MNKYDDLTKEPFYTPPINSFEEFMRKELSTKGEIWGKVIHKVPDAGAMMLNLLTTVVLDGTMYKEDVEKFQQDMRPALEKLLSENFILSDIKEE